MMMRLCQFVKSEIQMHGIIAFFVLSVSTFSVAQETNDCVFLHHSCGAAWLSNSLDAALVAKSYIDERNDIYYGTAMSPDAGRWASLGSVPGDNTNMNHWIRWFNDYLLAVKSYGCANGFNRIIMFKSCYPISDVGSDGTEPGDPFSSSQTLANYKAVYRHYNGSGNTYSNGGYTYKPLEDIFAENPGILFIPVTAPPLNFGPSDATNNANAHRARLFNNWLKNEWLPAYNAAHPALDNVAVLDWFNFLAYPDDHALHPNRLKEEYGGNAGDSHPNGTGNSASTVEFITKDGNFLDAAWNEFFTNSVLVEAKLFLEGSYQSGGSMLTTVRDAGNVPLTSPYADDPRTVSAIPSGVVDWVLVQLRSTTGGSALDSKSAFIRNDGKLVSDNGTTLKFDMDAADGSYYIVVRHRNHLAAMSASAHALSKTGSTLYDFSTGAGKFHGGDAKGLETGVVGLYSGDANGTGTVDANDRSAAWNNRNATGYQSADCNLSGTVDANDRSITWNNRNKTTSVP
jgi:hypothetical protein